jgi:hypothetical protein
MTLIRTSLITYVVDVPEEDIRKALIMEAAEKHGLVHDGKIIPGIRSKVTFDGRRGGSGSYTVTLIRDPAQSGQALIPNAPPPATSTPLRG